MRSVATASRGPPPLRGLAKLRCDTRGKGDLRQVRFSFVGLICCCRNIAHTRGGTETFWGKPVAVTKRQLCRPRCAEEVAVSWRRSLCREHNGRYESACIVLALATITWKYRSRGPHPDLHALGNGGPSLLIAPFCLLPRTQQRKTSHPPKCVPMRTPCKPTTAASRGDDTY